MVKRNIKIVLDERYMKRLFTQNIKTFFPGAKKVTFFYAKYLRYLSEESFLVRYEVDLLMNNGQKITKIIRGNRVPEQTYLVMRYYYEFFKKHGPMMVARPLAYLNDLGYILYEEYRGWILREFDHQIDVIGVAAPKIARQLAILHNNSPKFGLTRTIAMEQKYFSLLRKKIQRYYPSINKKFNQLADRYLTKLAQIDSPDRQILNHGDFQASNIVYDLRTKEIGFIDFASAIRTSPANDVATFLTHSRTMFCFLFPRKKIDALEKSFLKHYFSVANKKIAKIVNDDLGVFQARISLDVITTTAVFTEYNKSPYYLTIINEMLSRAQKNLKLRTH